MRPGWWLHTSRNLHRAQGFAIHAGCDQKPWEDKAAGDRGRQTFQQRSGEKPCRGGRLHAPLRSAGGQRLPSLAPLGVRGRGRGRETRWGPAWISQTRDPSGSGAGGGAQVLGGQGPGRSAARSPLVTSSPGIARPGIRDRRLRVVLHRRVVGAPDVTPVQRQGTVTRAAPSSAGAEARPDTASIACRRVQQHDQFVQVFSAEPQRVVHREHPRVVELVVLRGRRCTAWRGPATPCCTR